MVADANSIAGVDHEREDQLNSPIANKRPELKRAIGLLSLAAACIPLTTLAQQQDVGSSSEYEYVEHWTAQFPPSEFPEPRADLKDEDVILYNPPPTGPDVRTHFEFYLIDKQTGQYLSHASASFETGYLTVKGHTVYRGKIWIVLGEEIEHAVGTKVLVLDYRTGEQMEHIDGLSYMHGRDFSAEMLTAEDFVIAASSGAMQIPSMSLRTEGDLAPVLYVFDANGGALVGSIGMEYKRHNSAPTPEVQQALDLLIDQTLVLGSYAFVVKPDTVAFLDLRHEVLGTYNIGQPHTINHLKDDLYVTAWHHKQGGGIIGVPLDNRPIYLTRIYRWTPETEPEMLWDSLVYTGVGIFVGLMNDQIVMKGSESDMYLFRQDPRYGRHTIAKPYPSDQLFFHPRTGRMLVLAPDEAGDFKPALMNQATNLAVIDTHNLISWDKEIPWIIAGEGVIGESTATTPEQTVLTYGTFQVKPTSR